MSTPTCSSSQHRSGGYYRHWVSMLRTIAASLLLAVVSSRTASAFSGFDLFWTPLTIVADNGNPVTRCEGCVTGHSEASQAFVRYGQPENPLSARWIIEPRPNGKSAVKSADTGLYLGRCFDCAPTAADGDEYKHSVAVHATYAESITKSWAQFEMVDIKPGMFAFMTDVGTFVARCSDCWEDATYSHSLFAHARASDISSPFAQFEIDLA